MDNSIDWTQKRRVFKNTETVEVFVAVETGVMLVEDYVEGGQVLLRKFCEPLELIGQFTNAEIDNGKYEN